MAGQSVATEKDKQSPCSMDFAEKDPFLFSQFVLHSEESMNYKLGEAESVDAECDSGATKTLSVGGGDAEEAADATVENQKKKPRRRGRLSFYDLLKELAKKDPKAGLEGLKAEIENGRAVDEKNAKGSTALHAAGYLKRWDFAKELLEAGASPTERNEVGHSFFLTAVKDPKAPWRELLEKFPDLVEKHERFLEKPKNGKKGGRSESDGMRDREKSSSQPKKSEAARGPLSGKGSKTSDGRISETEFAALGCSADWDLAMELLEKRDFDALTAPLADLHPGFDPDGKTLGQMAVRILEKEDFLKAMAKGISIDCPNRQGQAPLHEAVILQKADLARAMLLAGANANAKADDGKTPLSIAVKRGDEEMTEMLLAFGANARQTDESGVLLSRWAEENGFFSVADLLEIEGESLPMESQKPESGGNGKSGKRGEQRKSRSQPSKKRKNRGEKREMFLSGLDRPLREVDEFAASTKAPDKSKLETLIIVKRRKIPRAENQ